MPVHARDAGRLPGEELGGEVAERADDLRLDQPDLLSEVRLALGDLVGLRVAVAGRAAHQDIRDEDVLARQPDLAQQLVQQLPGPADERQPLQVLLLAPGASPTNITSASALPAPKTSFVRVGLSGQSWQSRSRW